MKSRPIAAIMAIFLAFSLVSCLSDKDRQLLDRARQADAFFAAAALDKGKPHGAIVPTADILLCTKAYDDIMPHYGFTESAIDTTITINRTIKITREESFRSLECLGFLNAACLLHPEQGQTNSNGQATTSIQVRLGIYTDEYLRRHPDPNNADRLGRIGVFLVTTVWSESLQDYRLMTKEDFQQLDQKTKSALKEMLHPFTDDPDDPFGFDFGGLKP